MIRQLDHYNIRTLKLDDTIRFYCDTLGLRDGMFPGPKSMGAWLYDTTDRPVVHVIAVDPADPEVALGRIRDRLSGLGVTVDLESLTGRGTGALDHVAFECEDYEGQVNKLTEKGLNYTTSSVPSINLQQIFVNDPNGVIVELNFSRLILCHSGCRAISRVGTE